MKTRVQNLSIQNNKVTKQKHNLKTYIPSIVTCKVKVKLSLCLTKHYAMKTYGGVELYIPPPTLNLGSRQLGGQFHVPAALPPGKEPAMPIG